MLELLCLAQVSQYGRLFSVAWSNLEEQLAQVVQKVRSHFHSKTGGGTCELERRRRVCSLCGGVRVGGDGAGRGRGRGGMRQLVRLRCHDAGQQSRLQSTGSRRC